MGGKGEFSVTLIKKEVVVPVAALTRQDHFLPQSNLDLLFPPIDVCFFFCYKKHDMFTFESKVNILKKSLAQVLVPYYVLAGEMVVNSMGEPELLCNNRGVDFFEAYADVKLRDLDFYCTDESIRDKMLPERNQGMLCVQVTELKCGGVVVGCNIDHRLADAYSCNMFFLSWAENAQSKHISVVPTFQRSLIAPRDPKIRNSSLDNMYVPVNAVLPPHKSQIPNFKKRVSRMYHVDASRIYTLQALSNPNNVRNVVTKLVAFCAFIWKIANAHELLPPRKTSTLGILVNGRASLSEGNLEMSNMMKTYFGNVVSTAFGEEMACELKNKPLNWVAGVIHKFLKPVSTKSHFMDLVDLIESHRPELIIPKIVAGVGNSEGGERVIVSSCLGLSMFEVNFGWGKPIFGSFHLPKGVASEAGLVYPMPSPVRKGDWIVHMNMFEEELDLVEKHAGGVFNPLMADYLYVSDHILRASL